MTKSIIIFSAILLFSCSQTKLSNSTASSKTENESKTNTTRIANNRIAVLNELRNELLITYGTNDGWTRIAMGPCGKFAYAFYEEWNSRFQDSVNIVFMMKPDGSECNHILIRLPDKNLFDAGLGVMRDSALHLVMIESRFEDMTMFDYDLLDKRAYGLNREYPNCPNYSDSLTRSILQRHFDKLSAQNKER
jgi:hypothetical protein